MKEFFANAAARLGDFWEKLCAMLEATEYALWQRRVAVPDYWDGAVTTAVRCALFAAVLFAGVLLIRLCALLLEKPHSPRRIVTFALTFAAMLGVCWWMYQPRPVAAEGGVEEISLTRVIGGQETDLPLTVGERQTLTSLLESAQFRYGFETTLPGGEGASYRVAYKTADGEAVVWVSSEGAVRYTAEETSLYCPILPDSDFYGALTAR